MKIIDKNKDYYDYLQGVWEQDPKAVYVRSGSLLFTGERRPLFFNTPLHSKSLYLLVIHL